MTAAWIRSLILAGAFLAALPSSAAEDLPAAIAACRAERNDAERLACYDRQADELAQQTAAGVPPTGNVPPTSSAPPSGSAPPTSSAPPSGSAPPPAGGPPAAAATQEERFGYRGGALARGETDRKKEDEKKEVQELVAAVSGISTRAGGALVITLDNGQVWTQKAPATFRIEVGDRVKIEPGTLGSFLMTGVASRRSTRVTRLR